MEEAIKKTGKNAHLMYIYSSQSQKKDHQIWVDKLPDALQLKRVQNSSGIKSSF